MRYILPACIPDQTVILDLFLASSSLRRRSLRSFLESMEDGERKDFEAVLEEQCLQADVPYITETIEDECKTIIALVMSTKANTVIVPMHDVLCMGEEARLNAPSTVSGKNWTFRFVEGDFGRRKAAWLKSLTEEYNR